MLSRAVVVVPAAAVTVTALVLLGPGAQRAAIGARVLGVPVDGTTTLALRVQVMRSLYNVEDSVAGVPIVVDASTAQGKIGDWIGESGPDGIAEASIASATPLHGSIEIRVVSPAVRGFLGSTEIAIPRGQPIMTTLAMLPGHVEGDLSMRVDAVRGVLAAPFSEQLRISVEGGSPVKLTLHATGADVTPEHLDIGPTGIGLVSIKPLAHQVDLDIEAAAEGGGKGRWSGTLPIVPGAKWMAPIANDAAAKGEVPIAITSPVPRERAYVSLWSEGGRVGGLVVPLARDDAGFFRGEGRAKIPPNARIFYASVAGDALEQGAGTVSWPIVPPQGAVSAGPLRLLSDGVPAAVDREKKRAWAARRSAIYVVGAAGLLEVLLLLFKVRTSQKKLETHLATALDDAGASMTKEDRARVLSSGRDSTWLRAFIGAAVVALAFAMVAAVASFR